MLDAEDLIAPIPGRFSGGSSNKAFDKEQKKQIKEAAAAERKRVADLKKTENEAKLAAMSDAEKKEYNEKQATM